VKKEAKIGCEIISRIKPDITVREAHGWREGAEKIIIKGDVLEFVTIVDDKPHLGIRIREDGDIIITQYGNQCFTHYVENNLRLRAERPLELSRPESEG
jgi:hypothetical protein